MQVHIFSSLLPILALFLHAQPTLAAITVSARLTGRLSAAVSWTRGTGDPDHFAIESHGAFADDSLPDKWTPQELQEHLLQSGIHFGKDIRVVNAGERTSGSETLTLDDLAGYWTVWVWLGPFSGATSEDKRNISNFVPGNNLQVVAIAQPPPSESSGGSPSSVPPSNPNPNPSPNNPNPNPQPNPTPDLPHNSPSGSSSTPVSPSTSESGSSSQTSSSFPLSPSSPSGSPGSLTTVTVGDTALPKSDTSPNTTSSAAPGNASKSKSPVGAIVGAVVGVVGAVGLLVICLICLRRRRARNRRKNAEIIYPNEYSSYDAGSPYSLPSSSNAGQSSTGLSAAARQDLLPISTTGPRLFRQASNSGRIWSPFPVSYRPQGEPRPAYPREKGSFINSPPSTVTSSNESVPPPMLQPVRMGDQGVSGVGMEAAMTGPAIPPLPPPPPPPPPTQPAEPEVQEAEVLLVDTRAPVAQDQATNAITPMEGTFHTAPPSYEETQERR